MSTAVFPTLVGLSADVERTPQWQTTIQQAVSGKEVRVAQRVYPRRTWDFSFDILRSDPANVELQQLEAFFNLRSGMFDSFLYSAAEDNSVTAQPIGTGDGVAAAFQLIRAFGGYTEPVTAPNAVTAVYLNGTPTTSYSVSPWGTASPGVITFSGAPAGGAAITADFTFYWPVRFTTDDMTFSKFMDTLWAGKKVGVISII
jgi:uncharacterized protein (TIGR02217 family)